LDGVAITDHDTLRGAISMMKRTDIVVIPGIEVTSADGHILGLNLQDLIPIGLSAEETVDRIHDASGIAVACHPSAFFKGSIGNSTSAKFDAVEVVNSSAIPFRRSVVQGEKIASRLHKSRVAGSDAHYGPEIGCAYTNIEGEDNIDNVIEAILRGACEPCGGAMPPFIRLKREVALLRKTFRLI
jgi:predicted metal-dependent phosphoesterase TrpH